MKKFFLFALVFAVSGALFCFVGCTENQIKNAFMGTWVCTVDHREATYTISEKTLTRRIADPIFPVNRGIEILSWRMIQNNKDTRNDYPNGVEFEVGSMGQAGLMQFFISRDKKRLIYGNEPQYVFTKQ